MARFHEPFAKKPSTCPRRELRPPSRRPTFPKGSLLGMSWGVIYGAGGCLPPRAARRSACSGCPSCRPTHLACGRRPSRHRQAIRSGRGRYQFVNGLPRTIAIGGPRHPNLDLASRGPSAPAGSVPRTPAGAPNAARRKSPHAPPDRFRNALMEKDNQPLTRWSDTPRHAYRTVGGCRVCVGDLTR
jgi:hypothetical protein